MSEISVRVGPVAPEPVWRNGRPLSRALVASQAGINLVLTAIGPAPAYMETVEPLDDWFSEVDLGPGGIMVVEFSVRSHSWHTDGGREYDEELEVASVRSATREELESHKDGDWPWDPELWMVNWPEVRDWRPPPPPDRGVIEEILACRNIGYHTYKSTSADGWIELRFGSADSKQMTLTFDAEDNLARVGEIPDADAEECA